MKFLMFEVGFCSPGQAVRVELSATANVLLLDDTNLANYRNGRRFTYFGGQARVSPAVIAIPHSGRWSVVVNLGGRSGQLRASVSLV